jgi:hypothetical protein
VGACPMKDLRQFIAETLVSRDFISHVKNGLGFALQGRQGANAVAWQIASDWLEEVELRRGDLLPPGQVTQVERFVAARWPQLLEHFRGNEDAALQTMFNLLNTRFNDLTGAERWDD